MEDAAGRSKVLIAVLQKYGYDLEDPTDDRSSSSTDERSSSSSSSGSGSERPARPSVASSASILQLRERKNHQTALHIAVKKGHMDVLKALAKLPRVTELVNVGDRHANTALHFAASSPRECAVEMVELLFSLGASLDAVNVREQTPLGIHLLTTKDDNPAITQLFIRQGLPIQEPVHGTTYLHMAMARHLVEIGGALIAAGASINVPDATGITVGDQLERKVLVRLICFMHEGTQVAPPGTPRGVCKLCKTPKGLLDKYTDCNLCGRVVCKPCSKKAAEIKAATQPPAGTRETGRLCNVCATVVLLRDKQHRAQAGFNQKLFGCGMK